MQENYVFKIFILQTCISVHFSQDDYQYLRLPECAKKSSE